MHINMRPPIGANINPTSFADLTAKKVKQVSWLPDGWLRVDFDGDLTDAERAAVQRRIVSTSPAEEALRKAAEEWLNTVTTTSCAGCGPQVTRLTRLILGLHDGPPTPTPAAAAAAVNAVKKAS